MLSALKPSVITCSQIPSEHVRRRKMTYLGLGEPAGKAVTGCTARANDQSIEPACWHVPATAVGFWGLLVLRGLCTEQEHLQTGVGK